MFRPELQPFLSSFGVTPESYQQERALHLRRDKFASAWFTMSADSAAIPLDHRYRFETGGCPIEAAIDVIGGRWKGLILFRICVRPHRFHELRKELPHVSQRMLVRQLRELEQSGLIKRLVIIGVPAKVEYSPTDSLRALMPLLVGLRDWGAQHLLGMSEEVLNARLQSSRNASPLPGEHKQPVCH
jgi:DNA-binding HxlR family transcriptional regulator